MTYQLPADPNEYLNNYASGGGQVITGPHAPIAFGATSFSSGVWTSVRFVPQRNISVTYGGIMVSSSTNTAAFCRIGIFDSTGAPLSTSSSATTTLTTSFVGSWWLAFNSTISMTAGSTYWVGAWRNSTWSSTVNEYTTQTLSPMGTTFALSDGWQTTNTGTSAVINIATGGTAQASVTGLSPLLMLRYT